MLTLVMLPISLLASFEEQGISAVCLLAGGNVLEGRRLDFQGNLLAVKMGTCGNKKSSSEEDEEPNLYYYSYS